ncbi:BREX-1 system adenine-specific DNA-methyltransferase PglX [Cyanobium sp. L1E-Cus]|uniref:BREX-1 system adenine-specific DNA-methyltransferase PglX n=1 Tax=Cyanobium sp. L1E-Cus TaxID=2823714 RepID=UPI0020CE50CB|nr:BREX-1 system adenine-specific DNA-methyltransferase PglX [Cyanobium sp. L1E-Cus]MCP9822927.1 BREX-1 system adenine-specific DNA-methyltransferase PglX [Cyanobium sp. L1E-Cus]
MEKEQRSKLQKATQEARRLLEEEFSRQLLETYDINVAAGRWNEEPGAHLQAEQRLLREKLLAWIEHRSAQINDEKEALLLALREMAFTALNHFVALKLMEARELVRPCVSGGLESEGFQEFTAVAQGLLVEQESSYRLYLETIFEDVSRELRALFDPRDPASLLWPKRTALLELLDILNRPELAELWGEDETLGWIYQYFNGDAERKKMREESSAPRNSRELAVRNQFFTPRYVVEFLTDNTLGRIWYEMRQGDTGLKERCRYLVRRPNEIWLQPGEEAPAEVVADEALSQEELLRQPVHINNRPLKDPREIRMLDPACGSMHFGLYAFDLYLAIYEEAWEIAQGSDEQAKQEEAFAPFVAYAADFASKADFLREVPRLILQHNIHGVDIDPRATQIARLTLWLRAQRAWQEQRVEVAARPAITRSNVVCAEPMPGERELLADFVDQQFPEAERGLVQQLLETIFDKMQLAGEAGSLLKIEEEIRDAIEQAQREWQKLAIQQRDLFSGAEMAELGVVGSSLNADLQNLTKDFWVTIEERIYVALSDYSEQAESGGSFQRRLFAEDAAQGFAFIDICRKRYDVAVMNPPFGEPSKQTQALLGSNYPLTNQDLFAAFTDRMLALLVSKGLLGEISSRVGFFIKSFDEWRKTIMASHSVISIADLGFGVLDDATVEAASYIVEKAPPAKKGLTRVFRLLVDDDKASTLLRAVTSYSGNRIFDFNIGECKCLPLGPWIYWVSQEVRGKLAAHIELEPAAAVIRQGLGTGDNGRFIRALWEVPADLIATTTDSTPNFREQFSKGKRWAFHVRSGSSQPWYSPLTVLIDWENQGLRLKEHWRSKGESPSRYIPSEDLYFRPGFSWTLRAFRLIPYVIPAGCIPSASRYMGFPRPGAEFTVLGVVASNIASCFSRFYGEMFARPKHLVDTVKRIPFSELPDELDKDLAKKIALEIEGRRNFFRGFEPFSDFVAPAYIRQWAGDDTSNWNPSSLLGEDLELRLAKSLGLTKDELSGLEFDLKEAIEARRSPGSDTERDSDDKAEDESACDTSAKGKVFDMLSYAVGCAVGRWDVRYATGEQAAPELPDPFAPLPACPPGQLQNDQGLPACPGDVPAVYPVRIPWGGILVDDPNHPLDLEHRIREVIEIIWNAKDAGATAEAIEHEACDILGVKTIRDYFRKPAGFFADHFKRYSKSRRQAPIYWQLSAGNGNYSAWLYYHRFTQDTLYRLLGDFVEIRIQEAEREQFGFESQGGLSGDGAGLLHEVQALLQDLRLFKSELELVAPLWNPNLNDGVIINHAILWRITPYTPWQKKCKECWDKLVKGDYDWAHLAFHLWPERVIRKCVTDRSLAIAHGLEERLWQETNNGNWLQRQVSEAELQALLAVYSKPAVQNALERFLAAPPPVAAARTRAPRATKSSSTGTTRRPRGSAPEVDAKTSRQTLLVLTAAPAEGLGRNAIADLLDVEAASLTAVIKQLKEGGQIVQLGAARGAKYRLTEQGRAAVESQAGEGE